MGWSESHIPLKCQWLRAFHSSPSANIHWYFSIPDFFLLMHVPVQFIPNLMKFVHRNLENFDNWFHDVGLTLHIIIKLHIGQVYYSVHGRGHTLLVSCICWCQWAYEMPCHKKSISVLSYAVLLYCRLKQHGPRTRVAAKQHFQNFAKHEI